MLATRLGARISMGPPKSERDAAPLAVLNAGGHCCAHGRGQHSDPSSRLGPQFREARLRLDGTSSPPKANANANRELLHKSKNFV
jgi:hypothetical protein